MPLATKLIQLEPFGPSLKKKSKSDNVLYNGSTAVNFTQSFMSYFVSMLYILTTVIDVV